MTYLAERVGFELFQLFLDSVSYRNHVAVFAMNAVVPVAHCPPLPADALAAAAVIRNHLRLFGQLQRTPANHRRLQVDVGLHVHPGGKRPTKAVLHAA